MPSARVVIRAAPLERIRIGPSAAVVGLLALTGITLRGAFGSPRRGVEGVGWWAVPAIGSMFLLLFAFIAALWLRRRIMRIMLDDTTLTVRNWWGPDASWPRAEIKVLWYVPLRTNLEQGAVVLLLGEGERVLATLWHKAWDLQRLEPLAVALGVNIEASALPHDTAGLTADEARRRYPGIEIPVSFTHGIALGCLGGLIVIAFMAAWVALMVALSG
ncbi:hypothetical protein GCM10010112_82250 [Actinoplanes lobatus]|uniref:PH domain-containing protein n=1 Tax=Actinoplanes lobatus TaxID=113568 RepID=A0A7W7HLB8_9ACTN|nr:hypothetical protein [Actinoplanes lobatus]MBB4752638.1 hypothetical protein [Actinoplanes lobatus]GGN93698.1 hypothetical protein GCM10010112_82250 [Actinoplanes lobatus]GIE44696.1 hypothetical protein Alo02nite_75940 [Actinoplanes lobatus]